MEKKWIAISVILAIICACVVMSVPVIKVAYTVKEPYSSTETYYVNEPYTTTEPLEYRDVRFGVGCNNGVEVTNIDTVGGLFTIRLRKYDLDSNYQIGETTTKKVYLQPGESKRVLRTVKCEHNGYIHLLEYVLGEVIPPEKTVTQYRDVAKERTVTKYRDVTKYKYISASEYLLQGET